jgi:ammonium transporter, Amt family
MVELSAVTDDITNNLNSLWLLVAAALVLIMTPGVAFFYGGMVKAKSVISMMMMSFGAIGLVGVLWVIYGYGMSFGILKTDGSGEFSNWLIPHWLLNPFSDNFLHNEFAAMDIKGFAFAGFQATFAIITVALISGAIADRAKFGSWIVFATLWATLVYFPVASWVFNFSISTAAKDNALGFGQHGYSDGGWSVWGFGVNDFAGGTAVHINAGAAGLALALVLGKRIGFKKGLAKPHNVPLTLLGASLLWFGWFGFNAGSEAAVDPVSALAWINTLGAPAAAILGWIIVEKIKDGKATSIGAASGAVAGLVAITPACNILNPGWGLLLGLIVGAVCALAIELKYKLGFDDSLDVVGIHLVGGLVGTLYIGFFGTNIGLFDRLVAGDASAYATLSPFYQLGAQAIGGFGVAIYSFGVAWLLGTAIQKTIGFRITTEDEIAGVDTVVHGEEGYVLEGA